MDAGKRMTYDELTKVPLVREYEEAFRKATGVALRLVPVGGSGTRLSLAEHENPFCALVANQPAVAEACCKTESELQRRAGDTLIPQTGRCLAGLQMVAAPVVVAGHHLATWIGGQVLHKKPTVAQFRRVLKQLTELGVTEGLPQIKAAFFGSRLVGAEQFQASTELLRIFAQHLGENAESLWIRSRPEEPRCVTAAREFIRAHLTEAISLKEVAAAVHVSSYHFCRIFRGATGFTLTEYISRLRVEQAKALLEDSSVRITEVIFAVGFGSISQFNTVFRKCLGMTPTQYRAQQRAVRK